MVMRITEPHHPRATHFSPALGQGDGATASPLHGCQDQIDLKLKTERQ